MVLDASSCHIGLQRIANTCGPISFLHSHEMHGHMKKILPRGLEHIG